MNWWQLILKDGERIQVAPDNVQAVKRLVTNREPIPTRTRTVLPQEVQSFLMTDMLYEDHAALPEGERSEELTEGAAQAFDEPILTDDGVKAKWVKQGVMRRIYDSHYSKIPSYRYLSDSDTGVIIAYKLPVHLISHRVQLCTDQEIQQLEKKK